jgi:hypothetical protein
MIMSSKVMTASGQSYDGWAHLHQNYDIITTSGLSVPD